MLNEYLCSAAYVDPSFPLYINKFYLFVSYIIHVAVCTFVRVCLTGVEILIRKVFTAAFQHCSTLMCGEKRPIKLFLEFNPVAKLRGRSKEVRKVNI